MNSSNEFVTHNKVLSFIQGKNKLHCCYFGDKFLVQHLASKLSTLICKKFILESLYFVKVLRKSGLDNVCNWDKKAQPLPVNAREDPKGEKRVSERFLGQFDETLCLYILLQFPCFLSDKISKHILKWVQYFVRHHNMLIWFNMDTNCR